MPRILDGVAEAERWCLAEQCIQGKWELWWGSGVTLGLIVCFEGLEREKANHRERK